VLSEQKESDFGGPFFGGSVKWFTEITKHVGIDRIIAKRLRVLLQTDPAEPTVDVQVQSPVLLSAAVFEKG